MDEVDLVVIGAGIYGLTTASTYHRLHPNARILILDASSSIGGPWGSERIFPGLRTNNLLGMYEHPDFPMDEKRFGVKKGEHIPAEKMLRYLRAFAKDSDIEQFLRMNTNVEVIERIAETWKLHCTSASTSKSLEINTPKLVLATGITNKPSLPTYPTHPSFIPPIIHSKDFPTHYSSLVLPSKHTLVLGASKSAFDVVYACATQPESSATLLVRPSGNGPNYMAPSHVTPFSLWLEKLVFTRFLGYMSPCPWAKSTGFEGYARRFLHGTWLGSKIVAAFWKILGDDVVKLTQLDNHPETRKLIPWRGGFEVGNSLCIHTYPTSFFDLVRSGRIRVVVDEVERFGEGREVWLKSGEKLEADAVVCATGWEVGNSVKFSPVELQREMGLPKTDPPSSTEINLIAKSNHTLSTQYPYLYQRNFTRTNHPTPSLRTTPPPQHTHSPHRLYRFMVPPAFLDTHSIAFAGALYTLGSFPCAYIQSLWITAYFSNSIPNLPSSSDDVLREVYRDTEYCRTRAMMGYGHVAPDLVWDSLPYYEGLCGQLGLRGRRKGGVREVLGGYGPEDWRGLLGESERKMERKKVV